MKKLWRDHQLLVVLAALILVVGATTVWATWIEYDHNEGLGMENKAHFWSWNFLSYCYMQLGWNTLAEWVGIMYLIICAAKLREKFEAEK